MKNKTKTILFAALIAAMILPFSGMMMAEATPNEQAKEKVDRTQRADPDPPDFAKFQHVKSQNLKHEYKINDNKDGFVYPHPKQIFETDNPYKHEFLPYAYALCMVSELGEKDEPCFDSYIGSTQKYTEKSIMKDYARQIDLNYDNWEMSDRIWVNTDVEYEYPTIICTEFVVDDVTQYRMVKWVDDHTISNFENFRDDSLCDKWLPPIDDGIKIKWDKLSYLSGAIGVVQIIDADMNLDNKKVENFDIHVYSNTDHKGIRLTMTETNDDSEKFEGTVYFSTTNESSGHRLLVEDGVYAVHKKNLNFSRIINEPIEPTFSELAIKAMEEYCRTGIIGEHMIGIPQCVKEPEPPTLSIDGISYLELHSYIFLVPIIGISIIIFVIYYLKRIRRK